MHKNRGYSGGQRLSLKFEVPKVTRKCHPEAKPKDLVNEKEIPALADLRLHFAALRSE